MSNGNVENPRRGLPEPDGAVPAGAGFDCCPCDSPVHATLATAAAIALHTTK
jgi:hypothetical protein